LDQRQSRAARRRVDARGGRRAAADGRVALVAGVAERAAEADAPRAVIPARAGVAVVARAGVGRVRARARRVADVVGADVGVRSARRPGRLELTGGAAAVAGGEVAVVAGLAGGHDAVAAGREAAVV